MLDSDTRIRRIKLIFTAPDGISLDPKPAGTHEPGPLHTITFRTPADIIRFVNRMIRPFELIFLERNEGGDSYEFALFSVPKADEMVKDDRVTFHKIDGDNKGTSR